MKTENQKVIDHFLDAITFCKKKKKDFYGTIEEPCKLELTFSEIQDNSQMKFRGSIDKIISQCIPSCNMECNGTGVECL